MSSHDNEYSYQPYRPYRPESSSPNPYVSRLDPGRPAEFDAYFDPTLQRPGPHLDTSFQSAGARERPLPPAPEPVSPLSPYRDNYVTRKPVGGANANYYGGSRYGERPGSVSPNYGDENDLYDPYPTQKLPRQDSDEIPLRDNPQQFAKGANATPPDDATTERATPSQQADRAPRSPRKEPAKRKFFSRQTPWMVYTFTLIEVIVFIAELVRNSVLTSSPIEIHPQINPMLGPSFEVLVNMGARYVPCMKNISGIPLDLKWPCPNTTTNDPNDPSNQCTVSELCGFTDFGANPNQWFRFITPIFLHAGIVHIGFNLLLQLTLGREIERIIGPLRFLIVYISSGIFGFVLGGNFAASGIASMGASGALFGIIAINLLDLLYTWKDRRSPKTELAFIILDIVVSFALGLLPGLDNFSHIGGFLMGLVLGICILHSPNELRREKRVSTSEPLSEQPQKKKSSRSARAKRVSYKNFAKDPTGFFKGRKALWWVWWLVRAGALLGVLIAFIVLLNNFYTYHDTCSWCKYLSCINVNNWCDMGNLTSQIQHTGPSSGGSSGGSSGASRLLARSLNMAGSLVLRQAPIQPHMADLSEFI